MTKGKSNLAERAQRKQRQIAKKRRDPRFRHTLGKLVAAKLLTSNIDEIEAFYGEVPLSDALWAGQVEPRILELLPAIVIKKPGLFTGGDDLPNDLRDVVRAIRKGRAVEPFRGVPPASYLPWVRRIGHKDKAPTLLKSFRMTQEDITILRELKVTLVTTETDVIRRAIRMLARHQPKTDEPSEAS